MTTILAAFLFLPLPASLPEPKDIVESQTSHILDINGKQIATIQKADQNIPVDQKDIPQVLKAAVIASEDRNFYKHGGVDLRGSARALWADLRNRSTVQGGSTITQQYVKNAYTNRKRNVTRKVREAILASQLERQYDKDTILFKYLQSVYLGNRAVGVGAAAQTYFRKPVNQLTLSEAALLSGLIPAPSDYEPRGHPDKAEQRREDVLKKMLQQHYISQEEYDVAMSQPVWNAVRGKPPGPATLIYPPEQQVRQYPYFVDYVERYINAKYGESALLEGGLTIQTSLDPALQDEAEKAVANQLKGTKDPLEMALAAVEPPTGFVKALVGGRDFYTGEFGSVNLALGGCDKQPTNVKIEVTALCWDPSNHTVTGGGTGRQPGSSFKPYVLATAFSQGVLPTKVYPAPPVFHVPHCTGKNCDIHNNEGEGGGSMNLRTATAKSVNTVFAQLVRDVGCKETAEMAKKLGITNVWYSPSVQTCSGNFALGVSSISPLDAAAAYGVFAARGERFPATPIVKMVDGHGKVLEDNTKRKGIKVLDEAVADNVTDLLRGVISGGTGTSANIGRPAAGKTGTTDNFHDAWFTGYTPTLSTSVWMGYADSLHPLLGIKGVARVFGGTIPARTWHDFMSQALKDVPVTDFNQPAPLKAIADAIARNARGGFDPGDKRTPIDSGTGGPYQVEPPAP
ncbi:MAG: penicillin-binding protein, partial [Actinobacteria bacterium]|nr:penicillin-binding protein [Actinomycetota bacterium]